MKRKVFIEDVKMETQTSFNEGGDIHIYPCEFELGQHIVSGANITSQKGIMVTHDSGETHFRPYRKGTGNRYTTLFSTEHFDVKQTNGSIIVHGRFPLKLGIDQIAIKMFKEMKHLCVAYISHFMDKTSNNTQNDKKP